MDALLPLNFQTVHEYKNDPKETTNTRNFFFIITILLLKALKTCII